MRRTLRLQKPQNISNWKSKSILHKIKKSLFDEKKDTFLLLFPRPGAQPQESRKIS